MPIRLSDLNRPFTCNLPRMGEVQIRNVSWGTLRDLVGTVDDEKGEEVRARFVNKLLSQMVTSPAMDEQAVSQLHSSDIGALVACAATVMSASDDLAEVDGELPPRERLYRAIESHHKNLNRQVMESVRNSPMAWSALPTGIMGGASLGSSIFGQTMANWTGAVDLLSQARESLAVHALPPDLLSVGSEVQTVGEALAAKGMSAKYWQEISSSIAALNLAEPYLSDSLRITGWNTPSIHTTSYVPPPIGTYESDDEVAERSEEIRLERLVDAYDTLVQLEWLLRRFVAEKLQQHAGSRWLRQRVPQAIREEISQRKQDRETPDSLVHDVMHYLYVGEIRSSICRSDNWRDCFAEPFGNEKGTVEVMFNWIEPVRKDIAHSRPVSDDEYAQFIMAAQWLTRKIQPVLEDPT